MCFKRKSRAFPACLAATLLGAVSTYAQPEPKDPKPGPLFHIRITGDIECAHDEKAIKAALDEADQAHAPLAVLELGGQQSRLDIVWAIGRDIRQSKVPVAVYLSDDSRQVGAGQLCLGLLSKACAATPATTIRGGTNNPELAKLAPDNTAWEALRAELYDWAGKSVPRTTPEEVLAAILSPTVPLWIEFQDGHAVAINKPPAKGADAFPVTGVQREVASLTLDAKSAARLGLLDAAPNWSALPQKLGVKPSPLVDRTLTLGLRQAAAKVEPLLARIDKADDVAKEALKLRWPPTPSIAAGTYHAGAAKARPALAEMEAAIKGLESLCEQYPELMRRAAPGQTDVAAKPSTFTSRWRSMIQSRRDRLARLTETADKFEHAKD